MGYIVIFITASSKEESEKISAGLLNEKVAACVNIVPKIISTYWWQGNIESSQETLLVVKSRDDLLDKIIDIVKSCHSYTVPEIIAMPIVAGNKDYLKWIDDSVIVASK